MLHAAARAGLVGCGLARQRRTPQRTLAICPAVCRHRGGKSGRFGAKPRCWRGGQFRLRPSRGARAAARVGAIAIQRVVHRKASAPPACAQSRASAGGAAFWHSAANRGDLGPGQKSPAFFDRQKHTPTEPSWVSENPSAFCLGGSGAPRNWRKEPRVGGTRGLLRSPYFTLCCVRVATTHTHTHSKSGRAEKSG